jgi:hypothetical protein
VRQECTVRRRAAEEKLLVIALLHWGQAQEIARFGEIVALDDRAAHIDEDVIAGNRPART